jgi:hypothetical protein
MVIAWLPLLAGLFFGLIPPLRLINCEVRFLTFEGLWNRVLRRPRDGTRRRRWWKLPLVWIDPVRGYVTGELLAQSFSAAPRASGLAGHFPLVALFTSLMVILAVQTKGRRGEALSLSPAGFMAGLMLATMPLQVALGAMVVGAATTIASHRYALGYLAAAVFAGGLGFAFLGKSLMLLVLVAMVSAPAWMSWLRRSTLVTPVRC